MTYEIVLYSLFFLPLALAQSYIPTPRWAQAVALLDTTLYVHGGLSDPFNSYSYSSAPVISDLLVLDLSTSFNSSSPPWQLFSSSSSPTLAWHTLSAFNITDLLFFGGQSGPSSLTTLNNSAGLLSTFFKSNPSFFIEPQNWANEPMRRIRHSSSFTDGKVWIIGGEQADGSGIAFSEHYSFSPSGPEFVQLPSSSSAPPGIYGHVSLVLPDGRLLVLGGYCASCSELVPMSTVWSLDTTQNPPIWGMVSVSNKSLPTPRRDFAAVVLPDGQILIHGGGDAQLQTTYSDGWILDTGQSPMVWENVIALSQLGARKDHLAVQVGGCVLFCFGYGSSSPANASLFIYDPTTSSMVTSYTAPPLGSTPAIISLPVPSQTMPNPNSVKGTGAASPGSSSGGSASTSGSSSGSSNVIAIVLGTIFGFLGLVAGALATIYYMKRDLSKKTPRRFFPLADDPELVLEEGSVGDGVPEAALLNGQTSETTRGVGSPAVIKDILAHLGIDTLNRRHGQPRKDMFADEDAKSFSLAGHSGTMQKQYSDGTGVWSLRSVSALVRGVISREPSGSRTGQGDHEWEKTNEEDKEGLIRQESLHSRRSSRQTHRRDESFWSYADSFEEPSSDDEYDDPGLHPNISEKDADYDCSLRVDDGMSTTSEPRDTIWPVSVRSRTLTPLREASHVSLSDPSNSLPSLQEPLYGQINFEDTKNAAHSPPTSMSPTLNSPVASHSVTSVPQHSPLLGSTLLYSPSISRPDSWWSRLTKSPLLDRRASIASSKPLDFRDPTPAPPLCESEKTKNTSPPSDSSANKTTEHGRTVSSAHSGRTANTDSAGHLGESYDVVQRLPSDGSSSQRAPSLGSAEIAEQQRMYTVNVHARSEISLSSGTLCVDPPHSTILPPVGSTRLTDEEAPFKSERPTIPKPSPKTSERGTIVSSRVREYERRLSQELESQRVAPTRRREEMPSRTRPTIQYGVAPRASLFIANPDLP